MKQQIIIGLAGPIGCGKSTVASKLAVALGGNVDSFARGVREEVEEVFGIPRALMATHDGKASVWRLGLTVRDIMQLWGTNCRRSQDQDYWVKRAMAIAEERGGVTIYDDVRFPGEADAIRERGGKVFRIEPYPGWHPTEADKHVSEHALDGYDFDFVYTPSWGDIHLDLIATDIVYEVRK